jgi:bleomycin hydrolase
MKKTYLIMLLTCTTSMLSAQSINENLIQKMRSQYKPSPAEKALRNALGGTDIKKLAVNQDNRQDINTYFNYEVKGKGITDQESSGRCWLFTGMNVLRAKIIAKNNLPDFRLSQVYLFFYDQLEKSNLFLQGVIDTRKKPMDDKMVDWLFKNPINDGGQFTGIADLTAKYGIVPAAVMPETYISNNTAQFSKLLTSKLREFGLALREDSKSNEKALIAKKEDMLKTVYRMLATAYGEPPISFEFSFKDKDGKYLSSPKHYAPQSFYQEMIGEDLYTSNIMLMNDPSREFWKTYEIDFDRHTYDGHNWTYVNLPIDEIKKMAIASIKDSTMMYFSCDVGKFLDKDRGLLDMNNYDYDALFGTTFNMNKTERIKTFDSGSTHAMTLTAVDLNTDGNPVKWKVENSWGENYGQHGYLIMTDNWFNEYMFRLVINKKYATDKVLSTLKTKPVRLPAWDPMFASEE